jgi:hypothetical protein
LVHRITKPEDEMRISERILEATAGARDQAAVLAARAFEAARTGAERTADRVASAEGRVATLADAGRKLNTLAYEYTGRMIDQSVSNLKDFIDANAERLRLAAKATDVQSLYRDQLETLPFSRDRIIGNARATWDIVADTGRELQELALTTYAQLVRNEQPKAAPKAKRARKTATARKTAKKGKARRTH